MTLSTVAVLRPGDWVLYDGSEHQVLALAGTSVRLQTVDGADSVVLAGHLMASPGFAVVDSICRWSPRRSPSSPGATPATSLPRQA
jgi:hypothetical protein